jgi:hypothetical protein
VTWDVRAKADWGKSAVAVRTVAAGVRASKGGLTPRLSGLGWLRSATGGAARRELRFVVALAGVRESSECSWIVSIGRSREAVGG